MLPHQFQELLEKNSRGECTPQEEQFINDWYNNIGNSEDLSFSEEAKAIIEEKLWSAIKPQPSPKGRWLSLPRVAAIISIPLLACVGFYVFRQSSTPFSAPDQSESLASKDASITHIFNESTAAREVILSDGSRVTLQPRSELVFAKNFTGDTREVTLKGEAFFRVTRDPDHPFMVYANEVVTRVLGTCFNVKAYENDKEVTVAVKSGKVSVYAKKEMASRVRVFESPEVILTPNQQIVYNRSKDVVLKQLVEKPEIIIRNSTLFRMQFDNTEVAEIFGVLEENYGVEIRYDKDIMKACKLTTSMSDEGLYERIEVICKAIGASYSMEDAVITIKSNGC